MAWKLGVRGWGLGIRDGYGWDGYGWDGYGWDGYGWDGYGNGR